MPIILIKPVAPFVPPALGNVGEVSIPHLDAPFSLSAQINPFTKLSYGAKVVEQNDEACVMACVRNIIACPQGFREEAPDFGVPPSQFGNAPLETDGLVQAIALSEPRATAEILEMALQNDQERQLAVRIKANTNE